VTDEEQKRGRGRPRNAVPKPIQTGSGWSVKTYVVVDGIEILKQVSLGTTSKTVARAKCKAIAAGKLDPTIASRGETFELAARRIVAEQTKINEKGRRARISRLERFAFPLFGHKPVGDVTSPNILDALGDVRETVGGGKVTQSVRQLLVDVSSVLGALCSHNIIKENPAARIKLDRDIGAVEAAVEPRIILSDPEFERFAAFHLAQEKLAEVVMLSIASRFLGGMRTSDLHAWRWEMIDTREWQTALVPRPKTDKDLTGAAPHALDSDLVPVLQRWWIQEGCPLSGPVFPVRRDKPAHWVTRRDGKRHLNAAQKAGDHKGAMSYAAPLRNLLWAAGVVRPMPGFEAAATDEARRALCAIQTGGDDNARVDFHSFRRATASAAANSGMNMQSAMGLLDHKDPKTHMRYVRNQSALVTPKEMLPKLGTAFLAPPVPKIPPDGKKNSNEFNVLAGPSWGLVSCSESSRGDIPEPFLSDSSVSRVVQKPRESSSGVTQRQNTPPIIRDALGVLAEAVFAATHSGQWDLAADIVAVGKKHAATLTPPSNVTKLDDRRKR
jgi:integrase